MRKIHGVLIMVALAALVVGGLVSGVARVPAAEAATPLKPLLTGLVSRDDRAPDDLAGVVRSQSLRIHWRDLQPDGPGSLTDVVDDALGQTALGARVRLRVIAGMHSPEWVKQLAGGPVTDFVDPFDGAGAPGETIPRFWAPEVGAAYADLQRLLAARYDADRRIAEVVVSRCSAFYPEPFLRQASIKANRAKLVDAGYTVAADRQCHQEQVEAHRVWTTTRSSLAVNPAQLVESADRHVVDLAFTTEMMSYCRTTLGKRCVLSNNSIRWPLSELDKDRPQEAYYQRMYDAMAALGPPVAFQTAVGARIGDCAETLRWAVAFPAASVELPKQPTSFGCTLDVLAPVDLVLGRPTAPRGLTLGLLDKATKVRVSWRPPAVTAGSPVTAYRVLRGVGRATPVQVAQVAASARTWTDRTPPRRRTVGYQVVAVSTAGPGPATPAKRVTTR
jgi:hypothetical protein